MTTRPLLVFDLDGTLAETAGDLIGTLNVILAREGVAPLPLAEARFMLGAGARALIQRGLAAVGRSVSSERLEEMFRDFLVHYEGRIAQESHLFPGVEAALDRFEAAGWDFAVCTNKMEHASVKLLTALGAASRFKAICGQDTFVLCKPHKEALIGTINAARGDIGRAIMVGDSRTDIDTARNAGVPVVAVDFGYTDRHVSEFAPDRVISHFDQLWSAVDGLLARA